MPAPTLRSAAAASPAPPPASDPLVSRRVRVPYDHRGSLTTFLAVVLPKPDERAAHTRYTVRFDDGTTAQLTRDQVLRFSVDAGAGADAPPDEPPARKRARDGVALSGAAAAEASPPAPKRLRAAAPAASSSDVVGAAPSEPAEPPAAVPMPVPPAAAPADDGDALLVAFLRGIQPPLYDLDAILAALPASRLSMQHVTAVRNDKSDDGSMLARRMFDDLLAGLQVTRYADKVAFTAALAALPVA